LLWEPAPDRRILAVIGLLTCRIEHRDAAVRLMTAVVPAAWQSELGSRALLPLSGARPTVWARQ
jgi:hypothetical protein